MNALKTPFSLFQSEWIARDLDPWWVILVVVLLHAYQERWWELFQQCQHCLVALCGALRTYGAHGLYVATEVAQASCRALHAVISSREIRALVIVVCLVVSVLCVVYIIKSIVRWLRLWYAIRSYRLKCAKHAAEIDSSKWRYLDALVADWLEGLRVEEHQRRVRGQFGDDPFLFVRTRKQFTIWYDQFQMVETYDPKDDNAALHPLVVKLLFCCDKSSGQYGPIGRLRGESAAVLGLGQSVKAVVEYYNWDTAYECRGQLTVVEGRNKGTNKGRAQIRRIVFSKRRAKALGKPLARIFQESQQLYQDYLSWLRDEDDEPLREKLIRLLTQQEEFEEGFRHSTRQKTDEELAKAAMYSAAVVRLGRQWLRAEGYDSNMAFDDVASAVNRMLDAEDEAEHYEREFGYKPHEPERGVEHYHTRIEGRELSDPVVPVLTTESRQMWLKHMKDELIADRDQITVAEALKNLHVAEAPPTEVEKQPVKTPKISRKRGNGKGGQRNTEVVPSVVVEKDTGVPSLRRTVVPFEDTDGGRLVVTSSGVVTFDHVWPNKRYPYCKSEKCRMTRCGDLVRCTCGNRTSDVKVVTLPKNYADRKFYIVRGPECSEQLMDVSVIEYGKDKYLMYSNSTKSGDCGLPIVDGKSGGVVALHRIAVGGYSKNAALLIDQNTSVEARSIGAREVVCQGHGRVCHCDIHDYSGGLECDWCSSLAKFRVTCGNLFCSHHIHDAYDGDSLLRCSRYKRKQVGGGAAGCSVNAGRGSLLTCGDVERNPGPLDQCQLPFGGVYIEEKTKVYSTTDNPLAELGGRPLPKTHIILKPGRVDCRKELMKFGGDKKITDSFREKFRERIEALSKDVMSRSKRLPYVNIFSVEGYQRVRATFDQLEWASKAGYPWQCKDGFSFEIEDCGEEVIVEVDRGCGTLGELVTALLDDGGVELLIKHWLWWVRGILNGQVKSSDSFYVVFGKKDVYKLKKLATGAVRTIQACDWRVKLLWRYLFAEADELWTYDFGGQHHIAVNHESGMDWAEVTRKLRGPTIGFDLTGNDREMPQACIEDYFYIFKRNQISVGRMDSDFMKLLQFLCDNTVHTPMVLGNEGFVKHGGNPSGFPNTIQLNTVVRQCSFEAVAELKNIFANITAARYCGDDALVSVRGKRPEELAKEMVVGYAEHTPWVEKVEGIANSPATAPFVSRGTLQFECGGLSIRTAYYLHPVKSCISYGLKQRDEHDRDRCRAVLLNNCANFAAAESLRGSQDEDEIQILRFFDDLREKMEHLAGAPGYVRAALSVFVFSFHRIEGRSHAVCLCGRTPKVCTGSGPRCYRCYSKDELVRGVAGMPKKPCHLSLSSSDCGMCRGIELAVRRAVRA